MSPYKNFISAAKMYLNSHGFLRFLLSAHIAVFALGGLFYLLGIFLMNLGGFGGVAIYDALTSLGTVLMWAGLLLCIIAENPMAIVIATGAVAVCSLVAWIVLLARSYPFMVGPLFYFMAFGAICIIVAIKSEKFAKMRAEAAARAAIPCPRCGAAIPKASAFCPTCGAPNPAMQYAPPTGQPYPPQYAPPAGQPYAPPTYSPPYAPPAGQPYAPPYAPQGQPQYAPPPFAPSAPIEPAAPPQAPAEPPAKLCVNCGAELPAEAVFCGKCGAKQ